MKEKKCKICKLPFKPQTSTQKACSWTCALEYARQTAVEKRRKVERREQRERKDKLKTRSDWLREAQTACNAYIRKRDSGKPCISCGTRDPNIQYAAGHYRSVAAAPELRFHPFNIALQCNKNCNSHKSGNAVEYRIELVKRRGIKVVEWLEGPHQAQKLTIDDIKDIKQYFKEQTKLLED